MFAYMYAIYVLVVIYIYIYICLFAIFLGHMEVPRLGVESEL